MAGTTVKASCPVCGECDLRPHEVTLRLSVRDAASNHYEFRCPTCCDAVVKPADVEVIRALSQSGEVRREHFEPPHMLESKPTASLHPYTGDELLDDIIALYACPPADLIGRIGTFR